MSELKYYNDSYQGSLKDEQCAALEYYLKLNDINGSEEQLKSCIVNMDDADVKEMIKSYETEGKCDKEYAKPRGELRDYQTLGVAFAFHAGNYINGDSVGMGKTVETAGFYNVMSKYMKSQGKSYRALILTEKNLADQFRTEMVKFTGEFFQKIPDAGEKELQRFVKSNSTLESLKYSVIGTHALIKAPMFIAWLEQCKAAKNFPFHTLIVDESSVVGGKTTTQIVKAFKALAKNFKKIIFLNATPFETHIEVFYNQLNLLDPALLPNKSVFEKQYCVMRWNGMYNVATREYKNTERFKQLIKYHYFARTRKELGAKVDNCKGGIIFSPLSKVQKEWMKKTQMYKCVYDCPNYINPEIDFNPKNVPKLESLQNLLDNEAKEEKSVLIFTYYKEAQKALSEYLTKKKITNRILNGETKKSERAEIIESFRSNDFRILITNVQKGLNFGNCNFIIFYSIDPNPSKMVQFEGRITRALDIANKNVYILCSKGKEEKELLATVKSRAKATTELTNTDISVVLDILLGGNENEASSGD